jgi:hydroxymethylbilane synthase
VGTSSPRRAAQLLNLRPDLKITLFRGNVDTRLAKLAAGEADAPLLAAAGLERLGRDDVGMPIATDVMLPAPAQGAMGIEVHADDGAARAAVAAIDHAPTSMCVMAERALLGALKADCHSPVAALATLGERLRIDAALFSEDGAETVFGSIEGAPEDATIGARLARDLLDRAPPAICALFAG